MSDLDMALEAFQAIVMIVGSILILFACLGLWRFRDNLSNVLYARIHIIGIVDVTCIGILLVLGYPLVALTYFLLMPVAGHTIANARFHMKKEDREE